MTSRALVTVDSALAARRSEAAHKAWATRRAQGWTPRSGPVTTSRGNPAIAAAIERFETEAEKAMPDWHGVALDFKRALAARPQTITVSPVAQLPPPRIPDYDLDRATWRRLQWPSPILVVTFEDGEVVRAPAVSLLKKPVNAGRGLRVAIAFYQARICRRNGLRNLPGTRPAVPEITSCICESTGETYDVAACNAKTVEDRKAQDWKIGRRGMARRGISYQPRYQLG